MTDLAVFLLSLGGFAVLLLAMARHQKDWLGRQRVPAFGRALRLLGFATLVMAFVAAGTGRGWSYGAVSWFGWLNVAALLVVAANAGRGHIVRSRRR